MRKLSGAGLSPPSGVVPPILSFALAVTSSTSHKPQSQKTICVSTSTNRGVADVISNPLKCSNAFDLAQGSRHAGPLRGLEKMSRPEPAHWQVGPRDWQQ